MGHLEKQITSDCDEWPSMMDRECPIQTNIDQSCTRSKRTFKASLLYLLSS